MLIEPISPKVINQICTFPTRNPIFSQIVLSRLSRPSLAEQHPLPKNNAAKIPPRISLAFPDDAAEQEFLLSPNLTLPPAFGSAYVGEAFSCSLCANNELVQGNSTKSITGVRITADIQTPSQTVSLPVSGAEDDDPNATLDYGASIQRIIRYDLKEEGNHVLIVDLSYIENLPSQGNTTSTPKARSFRKLYQFAAQPCLSVRTKATELAVQEVPDKSLGPYGRSSLLRYVLEAQLENVSEGSIVLEQAKLLAYPPFRGTSLNWDVSRETGQAEENPLQNPRDVLQLAFLVEQEAENSDGLEELRANLKRDGRTILGQIALEWRSTMGEKGQLTTGTLLSRKRA